MYLIIDSREKPRAIRGIVDYFDRHKIPYETSKLLFGDYIDYLNPQLSVDRKQNIAELAKNCTSDHKRFRRELERVKDTGSKLVLLVEQKSYISGNKKIEVKSIEDLILWEAKHGVIRGEQVYRVLVSWTAKYPLEIEFCDKRSTGKRIIEILGGDVSG